MPLKSKVRLETCPSGYVVTLLGDRLGVRICRYLRHGNGKGWNCERLGVSVECA